MYKRQIYTAADEEAARKQLESVTEKWSAQYPSAMNRWHEKMCIRDRYSGERHERFAGDHSDCSGRSC